MPSVSVFPFRALGTFLPHKGLQVAYMYIFLAVLNVVVHRYVVLPLVESGGEGSASSACYDVVFLTPF